MKIYSSIYSEKISDVSDEELDKARHGVEFLMTQFPELEASSRQIKERSVTKTLSMWLVTK
jgi:hypothetical protein